MAKKIIEAHVIQKVGTAQEWADNDRVLQNGEMGFIRTENTGRPVNFRIGHDNKFFSELPDFHPYITNGSISYTMDIDDLNNLEDGVWVAKGAGDFEFGITAQEGYYTTFRKEGLNWALDSEIEIRYEAPDLTEINNKLENHEGRIFTLEEFSVDYEQFTNQIDQRVVALSGRVDNLKDVNIGLAGRSIPDLNNPTNQNEFNQRLFNYVKEGLNTQTNFKGNRFNTTTSAFGFGDTNWGFRVVDDVPRINSGLLNYTFKNDALRISDNFNNINISTDGLSGNYDGNVVNLKKKAGQFKGSNLYLPQTSSTYRTLAVSVNGNFADADGNIVVSGGGGESSVTVTRSELEDLVNDNALQVGALYIITNADESLYGGTELYLRAISENELEKRGVGKFYNPKYDQSIDGYGILDDDTTYMEGDSTIWGGKHWRCLSDDVDGGIVDQFTLDSDFWEAIEYNDTDYNVAYDEIVYDYDNDWIAERHEVEGGNIVSCSKATYDWDNYAGEGFEYNAIKYFQWGNVFKEDYGKGLTINKVTEGWFECLNSKCEVITNNILNNGNIYNNTLNSGSVQYNILNNGNIYNNTLNSGSVSDNTLNRGGIRNNTINDSHVSGNNINGGAIFNSVLNGIYIRSNILNGGDINFGNITSDISNTVFYNSSSSTITLGTTAKTILASNYSKEVKLNSNNQTVIQYINNTNQLTIVPITS